MILPKLNFITGILTVIIATQPILQPIANATQPPANSSKQAKDKLPKNIFLLIQKDIQKRFGVSPQTHIPHFKLKYKKITSKEEVKN
jgi:hypothetical protein